MTTHQSHPIGSGKALFVQDGTLFFSRELEVLSLPADNPGEVPISHGTLPFPLLAAPRFSNRLVDRLTRREVKAFHAFSGGELIGSTRYGLFFKARNTGWLPSAIRSPSGGPFALPLRLHGKPDGEVVFGEYCSNPERRPISVYRSVDFGRSFHPAYTFPEGDVRHIHNLIPKADGKGYWVLTGDFEHEPGIGSLDVETGMFQWIARGAQHYRAVHVFEEPGGLLYGTDTELEGNSIGMLDVESGDYTSLAPLPGSCLYGHQLADFRVLSTTVEPSRVNRSSSAEIWSSGKGLPWSCIRKGQKDPFPGKYFQYGSWVLPGGSSSSNRLFYSGKALVGADAQLFYLDLIPEAL